MPPEFHHLWRSYLGRTLHVSIGRQTFHGVLIGLQPVVPTDGPLPEEVQPWAIDTAHGIELVDPDNPAVSIFDSAGPITFYPPRPPLINGRRQVGDLLDAIRRAEAAAAKAKELYDREARQTTKL